MPEWGDSWRDVVDEVRETGDAVQVVRRRRIAKLHEVTGRNVIVYCSGWLQNPELRDLLDVGLNDDDQMGFMATVHGLDRQLGLDLVLHTPGGEMDATEQLGRYLRKAFNGDIRAFVPQLAQSGGTMIACACRGIVMGKHSSLGPTDPYLGNYSVAAFLEEWDRAVKAINAGSADAVLWQTVFSNILPTFYTACKQAQAQSEQVVVDWLSTGILADGDDPQGAAQRVQQWLVEHQTHLSHGRHICREDLIANGLPVTELEADQALQDAVLGVHHACIYTLGSTNAYKLIENHNGLDYQSTVPPGIQPLGRY